MAEQITKVMPGPGVIYRIPGGPVDAAAMAAEQFQPAPFPTCQVKGCLRGADHTLQFGTLSDPDAKAPQSELLPRGVLADGPTVAQLVHNPIYRVCFVHAWATKADLGI